MNLKKAFLIWKIKWILAKLEKFTKSGFEFELVAVDNRSGIRIGWKVYSEPENEKKNIDKKQEKTTRYE